MKRTAAVLMMLAMSACASNGANDTDTGTFYREAAIARYKNDCSADYALAMKLSIQKKKGKSREALDALADASEHPEAAKQMVAEMFGDPELDGRTYALYAFDACLISLDHRRENVPIERIRPQLAECESRHSRLRALINCIDATILSAERRG